MRVTPGLCLVVTMTAVTLVGPPRIVAQPQPPFSGTQAKLPVSVTAAYRAIYPARTFTPDLDVTMRVDATTERTVVITDLQYAIPYSCTFKAHLKNGSLALPPDQPCILKIATPDFCLLKNSRCDARVRDRTCAQESSAGNLGTATGILTAGKVDQTATGAWILSLNLRVDGCVLAEGYNRNAPIHVRGAIINVGKR